VRSEILAAVCSHAHSLFARGFTVGSGGNLSHRLGDGFLMESSGSSFGRLNAARTIALCTRLGRS